ncbi:MAG: hypothetical protein PHO08_20505 [Methylococcales bacterium]|nr:hypothetical protein [Methylococcales bacterium]
MSTPTFPRTDSLTARALMRLVSGQQFTHRDFQNATASYRLSGHIEQLRNRHGWPIATKEETAPTTDKVPRLATFGRYLIEPEVLIMQRGKLGERLDRFIKNVQLFEATAAATAEPKFKMSYISKSTQPQL